MRWKDLLRCFILSVGILLTVLNFAQAQEEGRIQGTVTDLSENHLEDIEVGVLEHAFGPYWYTTQYANTDQDGNFDVGVPEGNYTIKFVDSSGQYAFEYYKNSTSIEQASIINISDSGIVSDINASL